MDLEGKLLVAMPGMSDPRFDRSVILICAHSDGGAMGLIINKPNRDINFAALLDHLEIPRSPEGRDVGIYFGGPVERGRGFVLHEGGFPLGAGTMQVAGGLRMTATLDILEAMAKGAGPEPAILALGYSGWGPGQLEAEILRNDWLICDVPPDLIFAPDDNSKWMAALRSMGIDPLTLSSAAGHA